MKRTFEKEFYGKKIVVEIGELAYCCFNSGS